MIEYRHAAVWDGISDETNVNSLFVEGGRFADKSDGDSEIRDLSGLFVIPGLIDAHVHMCLNPEQQDPLAQTAPGKAQILEDIRERARLMLHAGITSARDLGGGQYLELEVRDEIAAGKVPGPRLVCAGQPITSVSGHCHFWGGEATSTGEALEVLERQHAHAVDLIKVMVTGGNITAGSRPVDSQFDDETIQEIVNAASAHGYHVAGHCHGTDGIRQAAVAGVRTVEHCSWVGEAGWGRDFNEEVVKTMAANDVWVSPTINYGWRRFKQQDFLDRLRSHYDKMRAVGVRLIASTDAGIPNVYHHDLPKALPVFAAIAGLSPRQALRSATSDCAQAIDLGDITGRIAQGYSADFVAYEADPCKDLSVLEKPVLVVARGTEVSV